MRRRLALLGVFMALAVLVPTSAASATSSPRVAPIPAGGGFEYFESSWASGARVYDRFLRATAPDSLSVAPLPADSGSGRRIVYSLTDQMVWLVDSDGAVLANYFVSGREGWPISGIYSVFSKSRKTTSWTGGGVTMRWMVRFIKTSSTSIGFHEIPRTASGRYIQANDQLGTPLSAGCVRQATEDAIRLYRWADVGTPVVVTS